MVTLFVSCIQPTLYSLSWSCFRDQCGTAVDWQFSSTSLLTHPQQQGCACRRHKQLPRTFYGFHVQFPDLICGDGKQPAKNKRTFINRKMANRAAQVLQLVIFIKSYRKRKAIFSGVRAREYMDSISEL